jgi:hypothetical protein
VGARRGIAAIVTAAAVCLIVSGIAAYGAYAVLDKDAFADRAVSTLGSDEISQEVAARIAARVVSDEPTLAGRKDAIEEAAAALITTQQFRAAYRAAAYRLNEVIFTDAGAEADLRVGGSGPELQRRLEELPGWRAVRRLGDPSLMAIRPGGGLEGRLRTLAPVAANLAIPAAIGFGLAGLALLVLAVARAATPRRGLWGVGIAIAIGGGLVAAAVTGARDAVLTEFDTGFGDAVVSQIWAAYLGDLRLWALAIGAAGLVVAAGAGAPLLDPRSLLAGSPAARVTRALGLLAVAALAVALPELVLHLALVTLAAVLVYFAALELLRVLAPPGSASRAARSVVAVTALLGVIAVATVAPG